jgi:SAM-dependent methyltransferase
LSELGLSFGNVAETYHRVRPPYSRTLLDRAQEALELDVSASVLDLAAGTGRLTEELRRRFADDVAVDTVFVGEAFHWFDPAAAIPELARVLRPRGGLAIVSTHWWETEPPLPDAALEVLSGPWERSQPQRRPPWDDAFAGSPFEPLHYERAQDELTVDVEALLTLYSTTSSIAALPPDERTELFARVRPLLVGPYQLPLRHELVWTRLSGGLDETSSESPGRAMFRQSLQR